jgi:hypothetical protein
MDQSLRTRMVRDRAIYQGVRGVNGTRYSDTTSTYVLGLAGGAAACCNGTSVVVPSAPLISRTDTSDGTVVIYIGERSITAYAYSVNDPSGAITDVSYSSPIIIRGLTNGTAYTFYVRAKNEAGYSDPVSTGALTPSTVPGAPVLSTPTVGNNQLSVPFTTPSNGGSAITGYKYALNDGSYNSLGLITSPAIITGLTNGTSYTVNLKATNARGDSAASNDVSGTPAYTPVLTIRSFTTVGSDTWIAPSGVTSVNYLVVGGGGGSGGGFDTGGGGGGGGGEVLSGTLSVTPLSSYNIVVGDGGNGGESIRGTSPSETNGVSGEISSFDSIIAFGGDGGYASRRTAGTSSAGGIAAVNGISGGSGGSGGGSNFDGNGAGGGGGGSSGNGSDGVANTGGNGGAGTTSSISGTSQTYGVGGRGANGNSNNAAVSGTVNTGNGARGGGATSSADENGAKGGSGIVILSYYI